MNWRNATIGALLALPLIIVLAAGFGTNPHAVPNVLLGRPAPAFTLKTLDGEAVSLGSFSGKPVVINFWSTWCEPCKVEHELLQQAAQHYAGRVQFLGVVYQDTVEAARAYLAARSNRYPQLLDEGSRVAMDYGVAGVPESFIIDAQGRILYKEAGVITGHAIRTNVDPLLAGAPSP